MFSILIHKSKEAVLTLRKNRVPLSLAVLLVLVLVGSPFRQLSAAEIAAADVIRAVETWVRYETADARPDAKVTSLVPWEVDGRVSGYIAHLQGGGFALCGADSLVLPVYFYSPEGEFDPELEDYKYILWEIDARKDFYEDAAKSAEGRALLSEQAITDRSDYWRKLIAGEPGKHTQDYDSQDAPNIMSLDWLTARWNQGSPYNDYCPNLTPTRDERTYVGCVATATAQLMQYWRWPDTGVGSGSQNYNYRWRDDWDETPLASNPDPNRGDHWSVFDGRLAWTVNDGGRLRMFGYWDHSLYLVARKIAEDDTAYIAALDILWNRLTAAASPNWADFGATTYDWNIMPDSLIEPPGAGDLEVAKLSYHVGIAVNMNWGVTVSTSGTPNAQSALENHFRYQSGALYAAVSTTGLIEEIQWLRPAFLAGCRLSGGCHVWLVTGYKLGIAPDHQFMINLGGGQGNTGWYTLDSMEFNQIQDMGTRVAPNPVRFVGAASQGNGSPASPYRDIDEAMVEAPDNSTLIFKAGSQNTFSGTSLVIDRPLTLKGHAATIE